MPKQVVNLNDTVSLFRDKVNIISTDVGWRGDLTTTVKTDIVGAINELEVEVNTLQLQVTQLDSDTGALQIGDLTLLDTTAKDSLVNAINETFNSHPTHPGDSASIDTGALTGATVISDLDINITTDTLGHVTDANAAVATRSITAANVGALPTTGGTMTGNINLGDNDLIRFGDSADTTIHHAPSVGLPITKIDTSKGSLYVNLTDTNTLAMFKIRGSNGAGGSEDAIVVSSGSNRNVQLCAEGSVVLETYAASGSDLSSIQVTGDIYASGDITLGGTVDSRDINTDGLKLDTIATSANNYSHPNHSGDVTSTGDGVTTIGNDKVTYAKMQNLVTANRVLGATAAGVIGETQIQTAMIADNAVTNAKIVNDAVSRAKLKDEVQLIIKNSAGTAVKTLYGAGS